VKTCREQQAGTNDAIIGPHAAAALNSALDKADGLDVPEARRLQQIAPMARKSLFAKPLEIHAHERSIE